MNNFITSQIRTITPIAVGALVSWLALRGINLDEGQQAGLVIALTSLLQILYYFMARTLERANPQLGAWLLGFPAQPDYHDVRDIQG